MELHLAFLRMLFVAFKVFPLRLWLSLIYFCSWSYQQKKNEFLSRKIYMYVLCQRYNAIKRHLSLIYLFASKNTQWHNVTKIWFILYNAIRMNRFISTYKTKPSIPFRKKHYRSRVNLVLIAGSLLHELDH